MQQIASGMAVSAAVAWGFAEMAGGPGAWTEFGRVIYQSPVRWVIMFLPLLMVFAFGAADDAQRAVDKVRGMDVIVTTTAKTDEEARALLQAMGLPFRKA